MGAKAKIKAERRLLRLKSVVPPQPAEAPLAPWTPFVDAIPDPGDLSRRRDITMRDYGLSREEADRVIAEAVAGRWLKNSRYTVIVRRAKVYQADWPAMIHLSIKRNDRLAPGPERWRDFQRIKDEIVGPEHEAVELYPSSERVVDTSNQYHLWVMTEPGVVFPFGLQDRNIRGPREAAPEQRPLEVEGS